MRNNQVDSLASARNRFNARQALTASVLQHVLGLGVALEDGAERAKQELRTAAHDHFKRRLAAIHGTRDEFGFQVRRWEWALPRDPVRQSMRLFNCWDRDGLADFSSGSGTRFASWRPSGKGGT